MIELSNVTYEHRGTPILKGITLSLSGNGVHGILGANNTETSALLDIICGTRAADSGTLKLFDADIQSLCSLRKRVGYMQRQNPLFEDMTAYEQLLFIGEVKKVSYDKLYKNIKTALELTGLDQKEDTLISNLTASERQRLGVAGTLLGNPELIVLCEPAKQADKGTKNDIAELIKKLGERKFIIVCSSDTEFLEAVCDDLTFLSEGKVLLSDTLSSLYERLCRAKLLYVSAKGNESTIIGALKDISEISSLSVVSNANGAISLKIEFEQSSDVREVISERLSSAGCPILSMGLEAMKLADIFAKLCAIDTDTNDKNDVKRRKRNDKRM